MASSIINSDDGVISGTSGLKSTGGDDGVLVFQSKGTETARITATGNVGIGTAAPGNPLTVRTSGTSTSAGGNIAARIESNGSGYASTLQFSDNVANSSTISMVGSATVFLQAGSEKLRILAGGGITFNGDTAAANALDDYEQGTFTVAVSATSGTPTIAGSEDLLSYTKIGNRVFLSGQLGTINCSGCSGSLFVTMPFTAASDADRSDYYNMLGVGGNSSISYFYIQNVGGGSATFQVNIKKPDGTTDANAAAFIAGLGTTVDINLAAGSYRTA